MSLNSGTRSADDGAATGFSRRLPMEPVGRVPDPTAGGLDRWQLPAAPRDDVCRSRARLRHRLADLLLEFEDAEQAMEEAASERALGVPCFATGALQARVDRCAVAVATAQAQVAALDVLYARLCARPQDGAETGFRKTG